ncbi:MAG: maltokinase [Frankiaceae bacterium]|nr:maltokinase [Frankiaceae bacterium]
MEDLLSRWLPEQRWFGAKGRPIQGVTVVAERELVAGDPACAHAIVEVGYADGIGGEDREMYQLVVGKRPEMPQRLQHVRIGRAGDQVLYDAAHDNELTHVLLQLIAEEGDEAGLRFRKLPDVRLDTDLTSIVMGHEQSNTSVVFGEEYILKLFRKIAPGTNPDLEITRALAETGCTSIVPPLGWIETDLRGEVTTLAMLQPFLRTATDGWQLAVTSVRDLYAEADLHADEVGGDFAGESERLGAATADVHQRLHRALPSRLADEAESAATAKQLHERLDAALEVVPELAPYAEDLRTSYDALAGHASPVPVQRIHGDFHLGQVLRTEAGWVLIDFEGEPARPLAERTALMSPLRDVAGMLRSFDYAARHLLAEAPAVASLEYRAGEWAERNRDAFCVGYARAAGRDPRDDAVLLRAFELDKAVYEVVYEARNRPTWLPIPLSSIERLVR